jgi:hypothetical protein
MCCVVCGNGQLHLCSVYLGTPFAKICQEEIGFLRGINSFQTLDVSANAGVQTGMSRLSQETVGRVHATYVRSRRKSAVMTRCATVCGLERFTETAMKPGALKVVKTVIEDDETGRPVCC